MSWIGLFRFTMIQCLVSLRDVGIDFGTEFAVRQVCIIEDEFALDGNDVNNSTVSIANCSINPEFVLPTDDWR